MGHLKGFQDIKVGKLFNFSTWDTERSSSRIVNPRCYLIVNVTAILISLVTYFGMKYLVSGVDDNICRVDAKGCLSQMLTVRNLVALYVVNASSGYFYVIYLYLAFKNRRKYFTEAHKEMEDGRSFWGHIIWCSIRTSVALFIGIMNNIGVFYFYGIEDEFSPQFYDTYNTYGIFSIIGASTLGWMLFWKLVLFIIKFFIWEVWFDFGHYWTHRMGHYFKFLYYFGHSVHHESISPDAWDGLNITFDDAFLTNFIPHMGAMFIMTSLFGSSFSLYEYNLLSSYKTFVEVTGHVGSDFKGRSFPICPYIPYYLGIDIGTAAYHSLHHKYYTVNFSKRFTLWDRVFGTIKIPPVLETGSKKEVLKKMKKIF